jgi:hypothetical protein
MFDAAARNDLLRSNEEIIPAARTHGLAHRHGCSNVNSDGAERAREGGIIKQSLSLCPFLLPTLVAARCTATNRTAPPAPILIGFARRGCALAALFLIFTTADLRLCHMPL